MGITNAQIRVYAGFEEQYTKESRRFFREFQKKRDRMRYKVKLITNESVRKQAEQYEYYSRFGKPEYRFVPGFAPVGVIISGDNILNVAFEETPVAVIITSRQLAGSYRRFFHAMWETAVP